MNNIVLIGFKKSGKTSIGKLLSALLKKEFIDVDDVIIKIFEEKYKERKNIFEIFQFLKEENFRDLEFLAFQKIKNLFNAVVATSGGCVLNKNNLKILKNPKIIIYLKTDKKELKSKIRSGEKSIFSNSELFEKTYNKRKSLYEEIADFTIDTDNADFVELSKQILKKINV